MAIAKPKNEPKHVILEFTYNNKLILPVQTAAKILALIEEGENITSDWDSDRTKITPNIEFTMTQISNQKILDIKKANLAGISYKEYLYLKEEKDNETDE